jgi:hypothetical protein
MLGRPSGGIRYSVMAKERARVMKTGDMMKQLRSKTIHKESKETVAIPKH